ncbi:MAG: hypothetical protein QOH65_1330, partial [Methylobacteriaceae bacterium]|nr:hypothetical protein [Methylobacteriaceae bacterium]
GLIPLNSYADFPPRLPKRFLLAHDGERLLESKRVIVAPVNRRGRFCRAYATKVS